MAFDKKILSLQAYTNQKISDESDAEEHRDAWIISNKQTVVQRLDPLATHHSPNQEKRMIEVSETPSW